MNLEYFFSKRIKYLLQIIFFSSDLQLHKEMRSSVSDCAAVCCGTDVKASITLQIDLYFNSQEYKSTQWCQKHLTINIPTGGIGNKIYHKYTTILNINKQQIPGTPFLIK